MSTLFASLLLACHPPSPTDSMGPDDTEGGGTDDSTVADDSAATDDSAVTDDSATDPVELTLSTPTWALDDDIVSIGVVTWDQSTTATAQLEFRIGDDKVWQSSPSKERAKGTHDELVLGVPFDMDVTVRVRAENEAGSLTSEEILAHTGPLPKGVPVPTLVVADEKAWVTEDRWFLVGASDSSWSEEVTWKIILDRQGRVVWAHMTPAEYRTMSMQAAPDGSAIVWDENTFWTTFDDGAGSMVKRAKIDGTILESIPTVGLHHTFRELPDGAIVWGGQLENEEVVQERTTDGKVRVVWNCTAHWEANGASSPCDGNGLHYNVDDDTLYFSSDNENSVVEIQRGTGELLHVWGKLPVGAWPFAKGSPEWFKQHSPTRTPDGHLMVSSQRAENNNEMVAREYLIDEKNERLELVWECGAGSGILASHGGEAFRRPNGNTILNYGPGAEVREVQPDCTIVWQLTWSSGSSTTKGSFLSDLYALAP